MEWFWATVPPVPLLLYRALILAKLLSPLSLFPHLTKMRHSLNDPVSTLQQFGKFFLEGRSELGHSCNPRAPRPEESSCQFVLVLPAAFCLPIWSLWRAKRSNPMTWRMWLLGTTAVD